MVPVLASLCIEMWLLGWALFRSTVAVEEELEDDAEGTLLQDRLAATAEVDVIGLIAFEGIVTPWLLSLSMFPVDIDCIGKSELLGPLFMFDPMNVMLVVWSHAFELITGLVELSRRFGELWPIETTSDGTIGGDPAADELCPTPRLDAGGALIEDDTGLGTSKLLLAARILEL
jgi:hypothetical protein